DIKRQLHHRATGLSRYGALLHRLNHAIETHGFLEHAPARRFGRNVGRNVAQDSHRHTRSQHQGQPAERFHGRILGRRSGYKVMISGYQELPNSKATKKSPVRRSWVRTERVLPAGYEKRATAKGDAYQRAVRAARKVRPGSFTRTASGLNGSVLARLTWGAQVLSNRLSTAHARLRCSTSGWFPDRLTTP